MKKAWFLTVMTCYCFTLLIGCSQKNDSPVLKGPYLSQKPPGMSAEVFSPGIFLEGEHLGCSGFLNNGSVFVFGSMKPNSDWRLRPIYVMKLKNGRWTKPGIAPFSNYAPYNFTVGPDDQTLYFTTLKSPDKTTSLFLEQANIWAVKLEMTAGPSLSCLAGRSIRKGIMKIIPL